MKSNNTAILLIAFNRPDTTNKVFECIRNARPPRLYISVDGPRDGNEKDRINCEAVRLIAERVDWDCEIRTKYSEKNLGCKNGVVSAIDWFFKTEEEGIILEDDIIPCQDFFAFCQLMLEHHRSNQNIKAILGFNYHGQAVQSNSFFYYEGFYPWGWATWRRAWIEYSASNFELRNIEIKKRERVTHINLYNSLELNLELIKNEILDTWDYQFMYMLVVTGGLVVAPYANLIKNIGVDGAHSVNNVLNFQYGLFDIEKILAPKSVSVDERLNNLFLLEHKQSFRTIFLKKLLLKLSLYKLVRKMRKIYLAFSK